MSDLPELTGLALEIKKQLKPVGTKNAAGYMGEIDYSAPDYHNIARDVIGVLLMHGESVPKRSIEGIKATKGEYVDFSEPVRGEEALSRLLKEQGFHALLRSASTTIFHPTNSSPTKQLIAELIKVNVNLNEANQW